MLIASCKFLLPAANPEPPLHSFSIPPSIPQPNSPSLLNLRCTPPKASTVTISDLTSSHGSPPESAISASDKVQLEALERPNSVLTLLESYGFSKTQISKVVKKRPSLLSAKPEKTLLPKLQFLRSIGVSEADLAKTISSDPTLLTRSLEKQIIPSYNLLKSVVQSDDRVVAAMKRTSWVLQEACSKNLVPNITFLRQLGVPEQSLNLLLTHFPEAVLKNNAQFCKIVDEVKGMGFNPLKSTFVLAIHAISGKEKKLIWDRSCEVYRQWGWSQDDILMAFRKHPSCMILSEKKIIQGMEFLVNKMGWPTLAIARCPVVLFLSLEKRIVPRSLVVQVLSQKGLIKKKLSLGSVMLPVEKLFLERFVTRYQEEVPQLLSVYQGKMDVKEVFGRSLE